MRFPRRLAAVLMVSVVPLAAVALAALPELAPGTWALSGTVKVRACVRGRCETQAQALQDQVALSATMLTGTEGLLSVCPASAGDPTGLTELVRAPRGWYRLRVLDRQAVAQLMANCLGEEFLLKKFAARVRVTPDGRTLDQRFVLGGKVRANGRTGTIRFSGSVHGELTAG